jgi:ABC-type multidrug transport system fused ATPase/permease subunit
MEPTEESKETGKKYLREGLRAIWRHLQPFHRQMALFSILGIVSALANGFVPYLTGRFFDALIGVSQHSQAQAGPLSLWAFLLVLWALVEIVANNIDWFVDRLRRNLANILQFKIQTDGFTHLFRLPLSYHKNTHINGDLQKISMASWRVSAILETVGNIVPQFLSIFIGIILASTINVLMAGVLLVGVLLYIVILVFILRPIAAIESRAHRLWNESWDDAAAAVHQIESVKQAAAEGHENDKVYQNLFITTRELWFRLERNWSNVNFFQRTIVFLTQLVIFILSVHFVANGTITVGQLVALNGYALMFFGPVAALGSSWQIIQNGMMSAASAESIFTEKEEVYSPSGAVSPKKLSGEVRFDKVSFRYAPDQPEVLSDINLVIKPGQSVALVGESGVGKSTSISLISGYYFPEKGSVFVDGIDTRKFNLQDLRRHIAVVPQEVALFNDSIRTNIKYGSFNASDEDILRVAKEAHIDDFVMALPKNYDTVVGERGVKLSVGQKQRVAIARAMLRDPAILILDEPTSALDASTEKIVTEALEKLMRDRTTFIIAHRLSTVRKADMILVFEKGRVAETGTHDELIARPNGIYRRLYEYQIGLH